MYLNMQRHWKLPTGLWCNIR